MFTYFASHKTTDVQGWIDAANGMMKDPEFLSRFEAMGIKGWRAYKWADGDGVTIAHDFADKAQAEKFHQMAQSDEFQAMIKQSGGILPMREWFSEPVIDMSM